MEAASFVHPKLVPQMAGAEEVFAALERRDGVTYAALALNRKGLDRAVAAGADELHLSYPLTETFAQRNQNMGLEEAAEGAAAMVGVAHAAGLRATVTLGVAFGCPFEGRVDPGVVVEHAARMNDAGADELMLADTIGVGVPRQVHDLVPRVRGGAGRPAPAQHAQHRLRQRRRRPRARREPARRLGRRPRRLPVRAARDREHRHRGPRLPARGRGRRDRRRPRRADRRQRVAVGVLGRDLPGLVARAGGFPQVTQDA